MEDRIYLVETVDELNNHHLLGLFQDLKDAEIMIRKDYSDYDNMEEFELFEYAHTFGPCFNTELSNEEDGSYLSIFGYILTKAILDEMMYVKGDPRCLE